jgi:hypothetical protein
MRDLYELTEKGLALPLQRGLQPRMIMAELHRGPRTTAQVVEAIKESLVTRQDPTRVVMFYMSRFKKNGIIAISSGTAGEVADAPQAQPSNDNVPDRTIDEEREHLMAVEPTVDEAPPADAPEVPQVEPDYLKCSLRDAIVNLLDRTEVNSTTGIVDYLNGIGRKVNSKQVIDAISKLVKRGEVRRENGLLEAR